MKFILMGLIKSFTKEMGRSPNIGELNLLRREAELIERQDKIIPFPQGGKDKVSPFKPRPEGGIPTTIRGETKNMSPDEIMDFLMNKGKGKDTNIGTAPKTIKKKPAVDPELQAMDNQNQMFQDFSTRNMTGIEAMKEASALIGRKGKYKNISDSDAKTKLGELQEIINKANAEPDLGTKLKDLPDDIDPDAMADGGRAGYSRGGLMSAVKKLFKKSKSKKSGDKIYGVGGEEIDVADLKKSIGLDEATDKKSMEDLEKKLQMIIGKERTKHAGGGLAYMLGESRDNLKEGGPPNPGRRNFMKLMAGLASIPIIGKFIKPAAKVAKVTKVVPLQNTSTTMPAWFPKFVDKIINKGVGKKIDADLMQYEVKELPGIKVTKHDDGRVFVEGKNDYSKSYEIEYEPPGHVVVDEKTGKAVKTKGDFRASEEVPVNMDPDGNVDFDGEILESVDNILSSDARTMEEFATGKKIKKMKRGEFEVGRAESLADAARKGEDFATGGLAKLLGE